MSGRLSAAEEKQILLNLLCEPDDAISLRLLQLHRDDIAEAGEANDRDDLPEHDNQHTHATRPRHPRA
jgi:hypothetical protein